MTAATIAAEITAALQEASAATGNGPLNAVLIHPGAEDQSTYPATYGADTETPCAAVVSSYSDRDRDGTNIRVGDVRIMLDASVTPTVDNKIRVGTVTYDVVRADRLAPGGVTLMWEVQGREAGQDG